MINQKVMHCSLRFFKFFQRIIRIRSRIARNDLCTEVVHYSYLLKRACWCLLLLLLFFVSVQKAL